MTNIKLDAKNITLKNTDMNFPLLECKCNKDKQANGQLQSNIMHAMKEKLKES